MKKGKEENLASKSRGLFEKASNAPMLSALLVSQTLCRSHTESTAGTKANAMHRRIIHALKWTHLRSVRIEEVESGSVRVLHKIVRRRLAVALVLSLSFFTYAM